MPHAIFPSVYRRDQRWPVPFLSIVAAAIELVLAMRYLVLNRAILAHNLFGLESNAFRDSDQKSRQQIWMNRKSRTCYGVGRKISILEHCPWAPLISLR